MDARLQAAIDAAELACRGLTDKHVAGIGADDARVLLTAADGPLLQLKTALQSKTGTARVWTNVQTLRQVLTAVSSPAAGTGEGFNLIVR